MILKIKKLSKKKEDWYIADLVDNDGLPYHEANINKFDRNGRIQFIHFDSFKEGDEIDVNPWKNPTTGKWSIYPNEEKKSTTGKFGASGGIKMMEKKQEGIEKSQDRKEEGIKVSASMRDAVQLAIRESEIIPEPDLEFLITKWRKWLLDNWDL